MPTISLCCPARWPSGLRRCVQARVIAMPKQQFRSLPEAWVRIPLLSLIFTQPLISGPFSFQILDISQLLH